MLTSLHVVSLYVSVRYRPLEAMCKVQVELVCQCCHFYYMENDPIVERDRAALNIEQYFTAVILLSRSNPSVTATERDQLLRH